MAQADDVFPLGLPGAHGIEAQGVEDPAAGHIEFGAENFLHFQAGIAKNFLDILQHRQQIADPAPMSGQGGLDSVANLLSEQDLGSAKAGAEFGHEETPSLRAESSGEASLFWELSTNFSIFTAHTLYSGILATGSRAAMVSLFTAAS